MQEAKRELRKHMRKVLKGISPESVTLQSSIITKNLTSLPEYQRARRIGIYLSMPAAEVSTVSILQDAFQRGKDVYVPYLHTVPTPQPQSQHDDGTSSHRGAGGSSIMVMLQLKSMGEYLSLPLNSWGIPSLDPSTVSERRNCLGGYGVGSPLAAEGSLAGDDTQGGLDFIIMPGVAFDEGRRRLGHGRGYYDRFLSRYDSILRDTRWSNPFLAALAFKEQVLPPGNTVPTNEHDYPVDAIVTS